MVWQIMSQQLGGLSRDIKELFGIYQECVVKIS